MCSCTCHHYAHSMKMVSSFSLKAHLQSPYHTRNLTCSSVPRIQKENSDSLLHTASDKGMEKKIMKLEDRSF